MTLDQTNRESKKLVWTGRILSALPALLLLLSAVLKFMKPPAVTEGMQKLGYPDRLLLPLGFVEALCTVLYLIPQTSVLGAILVTAYLGGATASNLRVGEPIFGPIILGMIVWLGLFLRYRRLRSLLPLRS